MGAEFDECARPQRADEPDGEGDVSVPRADNAGPGSDGKERVLCRVDQPVKGVVRQGLLRGLRQDTIHCARSGQSIQPVHGHTHRRDKGGLS